MSEIINSSEALATMLLGFAIVSIIINLVLFIAIVCTAINTSKTNKELQEIKQILIDENTTKCNSTKHR